MKILFMGTPEFSVQVLEALVEAGHEIVAVYTQPPRPAGRGKALRLTPVAQRAEAMGLPVFSPLSLRDPEEISKLAQLKADIGVVVAYGLILPQAVLDAPRLGCLNIHASLLPRWRGAAPIQRAIMAGDVETGVCIMQMDAGLDTGPVRSERRIPITAAETASSLHDRLADIGSVAICDVLEDLDEFPAVAQSETGVTYAEKIDKAEARIDWTQNAVSIDRNIRGLSPFPGAWTELDGQRIKLLLSEVADGSGAPGSVLDDELTVGTGQGAVKILRLQRPGKSAASASELLRGYPIGPGQTFT